MVKLQLRTKEKEILVEILNGALSDLRFEIADTEKKEFRDGLKTKEEVLNKVLKGLTQSRGIA